MATLAAFNGRVRRASCLNSHWRGDRIVLENYLSHRQLTVHPAVMQLIAGFDDFAPAADVTRSLDETGSAGSLFPTLMEADVLIQEGSDLDLKEQLLQTWEWGHDARYFHYATQNVDYTFDFEAIRTYFEEKAQHSPPPSPFKSSGGERIPLPPPQGLTSPLQSALTNRRTVRDFERAPLALSDLATILHWTWGMQRQFNQSELDRRILKTSPSGGARHPIEVYPLVQRALGVMPGIYHYNVEHHALERLGTCLSEDHVVELFSGQHWVRDAAVLFLLTAVLPRSMWKYDHSRAYRVVLLDAGHLGQTFHLVCTALGLGPFTTAALQDQKIEEALGIDGVTEVAVYGGAVGRIKPSTK